MESSAVNDEYRLSEHVHLEPERLPGLDGLTGCTVESVLSL